MSGGGSIQAMVTAMKNNARRRKTGDKSMMGVESGSLYSEGVQQKDHSPEAIKAFKNAYKLKADKEARRRLIVLIAVIIFTPMLCYGIFQLIWFLVH